MAVPVLAWGWHGLPPTILSNRLKLNQSGGRSGVTPRVSDLARCLTQSLALSLSTHSLNTLCCRTLSHTLSHTLCTHSLHTLSLHTLSHTHSIRWMRWSYSSHCSIRILSHTLFRTLSLSTQFLNTLSLHTHSQHTLNTHSPHTHTHTHTQ